MTATSFRVFFTVLLWSLTAASAQAAATIEMDLNELVGAADRIIVGKCATISSQWVGDKIYTNTTIAVEQSLKGDSVASYVVTTLGGTAVHPRLQVSITMDVSGGLQFRPDEEVVLFTKQNRLGQHQVVGSAQGKFTVQTDVRTGEKTVPVGDKKLRSEKLIRDILGPDNHAAEPKPKETNVISSEKIQLNQFTNKIKKKIDQKQSGKKQQ